MYVLDTNILSTLLQKATPSDRETDIRDWLMRSSETLFISTISIAEIEAGIAKSERQGASRKVANLSRWLNDVLDAYADRMLPLDIASARLAGRLLDKAYAEGGLPDFEDAAIAATAQSKDFTVITRNAQHFQLFGVPFINPYDHLP